MIALHKLNGDTVYVNVTQIVYLLVTGGPDTRLMLTDGSMLVVQEAAELVAHSVEDALRRIFAVGRLKVVSSPSLDA
jgi:uncharacterized protein YlzI (FlbEa/FlbD family)